MMAIERIPAHLEKPVENISNEVRRTRILNRVQRALVATTLSLENYIAPLPHDESIKILHHDTTNIVDKNRQPVVDDEGTQRRLRYYSLWTSFADMRLLENGHLARTGKDWPVEFERTEKNSGDDSYIVTLYALQTENEYDFAKLTEIAQQLEKMHARITP
jgi:hypothetical protein